MLTTEQDDRDRQSLIMVVDDNIEFLSGVQLTLEMEGYKVQTATNGQQALDQLQASFLGRDQGGEGLHRLPELILADIMMPVMDGYELYERVRASPYTNHIPFVFLTAKSGEEDIRHGKEMGADDYLAKPFSPEDLLASVRGKLRRTQQRKALAARLADDFGRPRSGIIIAVAVISALIIIAFCLGLLLPALWP